MNNITYTDTPITGHITRISDGTDVCEYLVQGSERAILIDTGYGLGDLRAHVEGLVTGPYDVVCTHGHVDHASGAAQFDEVYLNEADWELYRRHTTVQNRREFLEGRFPELVQDMASEDFVPQRTAPFLPLEDGQVFGLGDIHMRAIHVPGHTHGMMVLVDEEERVAFFGDACGVFTLTIFPEATTIAEYRESLVRLQGFEDGWDRVLRQHGTCESPKSILAGNIGLCDLILAGKDDHAPTEFDGQQAFMAKAVDPATGQRLDGGEGNLVYREDNIR